LISWWQLTSSRYYRSKQPLACLHNQVLDIDSLIRLDHQAFRDQDSESLRESWLGPFSLLVDTKLHKDAVDRASVKLIRALPLICV